jgi:hypothetical protein
MSESCRTRSEVDARSAGAGEYAGESCRRGRWTNKQASEGGSKGLGSWRMVVGARRDKRDWAKGEEEVDHGDNE